jgi:hypothetical protein
MQMWHMKLKYSYKKTYAMSAYNYEPFKKGEDKTLW